MNLIASAPLWLLVILACVLAAAMIEDVARLRISNPIPLAVLAGAIVGAIAAGPSFDLWQNAAVFALMLILGTAAFAAGLLGGGDVKLLAAIGLWLDFHGAIWFISLVFLCGGAVAILYMIRRLLSGAGMAASRKSRVPYGLAIGLGALAMIALNPRFSKPHVQPLPPIRIAPRAS